LGIRRLETINPTPKKIDNVDPLLTRLWGQGTYYNQLGGVNFYAWAGKGKGTP
jgi:hypothetical protein